jgi:ribosome-binding protein aMBF1 (putative translation factor)
MCAAVSKRSAAGGAERWGKIARKRLPSQSPRLPTILDFKIGARIRDGRRRAALTQEDLAEALGTTFQQVQKYEAGRNRVAASRLVQIARFMSVSPMWLLVGEKAMTPLDGPPR